jgi:hypothetical protein
VDPASDWTGRSATALQSALRLSNEGFAAHLGIAVRTIATWHQKPSICPRSEMQQLLDTALRRADDDARHRFSRLTATQSDHADTTAALPDSPHIVAALEWIDQRSRQHPGWARRAVSQQVSRTDLDDLGARASQRSRVRQRDLSDALRTYYDAASGYGHYASSFGSESVETSVLTRPEWLDLDCLLLTAHDRLRVSGAKSDGDPSLDDTTAAAAVRRLAEAIRANTRFVNSPIYQLTSTAISKDGIGGTVRVTDFVHYALTMDLLEGELTDALATGRTPVPGNLPLRDHYLPDIASVIGIDQRLCAGGALALLAIARPTDPFRGRSDYLILVQERSGHVLNAARRLAVIPKGFHQPLTDVRADAQIGATLLREMEEELFGRGDLDNTLTELRHADPMHPSRLSEPLRYLLEQPRRLRMECTAFGINLVSGNYEFAGLIVIDDEDFWARYGGLVEANWESSALRRYSSTDDELLADLIADEAWSNEGLFAMTQGLHRLAEIGGPRVCLPPTSWEIA